jgi:hypothetical protein
LVAVDRPCCRGQDGSGRVDGAQRLLTRRASVAN